MATINRGIQVAWLDGRYVQITGSSMTGALSITVDNANALLVEQAGGTDILKVDTVTPLITIGSNLTLGANSITAGSFITGAFTLTIDETVSLTDYMQDLVDDASPQLGGDLDGQTFDISTTGDLNLGATPTYDNACTLRVSQGAGMVADFHAIGGGDDTYIHLGHTDVSGVGYGHKVFYVGSGSGDANYLEIRSDNSAAVGGAGITHMRYHQASLQSVNYDDMTMDGDQKVLFRDSAIYVNSIDDGHLDLTADISIDLNAPDVAVSGDLTVSGYISGAWDIFQDFDTTLTYSSGLVATIATTDGASTKTLTLTRNADNQISAIACVIT